MKKYAILIAIILLISPFVIATDSVGVKSTVNSIIAPTQDVKIVPEEKSETDNGLIMSTGYVENSLNYAVLVKNISFAGNSMEINIIVPENSTWTYARLDGVLVIPKTPSIIDAHKTSYYKTSRQLHLSFDGTDEVDIYFNNYNVPQIVVADTNIKWSFDNSKLSVKSDGIMKDIDIYWTDKINNTVAVMDRKKAESIEYSISKLMENLPQVNEVLIKLRLKNEELKSTLFSLESRIKTVSAERDSLKDTLSKENATVSEMDNRITGNAVVNQSAFALAAIITIISAIVLFDVVFLKRRVMKDE